MGSGHEDRRWLDPDRVAALRRQSAELRQMSQEVTARVQATRAQIARGRSSREVLHDSEFARLVAKQETMAVIEQAKGIIMAQQWCAPDEAFDVLRQVSQRTNVKLHVVAARIVEQVVSRGNGDNVTPIALGATRYLRPDRRAQPPTG